MFSKVVILVLALVMVACGPAPLPESISVQGFSAEQAVVITDVLSHWCDATGWCPTVNGSGSAIIADSNYARHGRNQASHAYNDDINVYFDTTTTGATDLNWLWMVIAHELGHYGTRDHGPDGSVMGASHGDYLPMCLDQATVDMFCDDSQQCTRQVSTCQP